MAGGRDQLRQQVERRRGKAEHAAAEVQMDQDRLAEAVKADDRATKEHRRLKESLKQARAKAKQLSVATSEAVQLKKSARQDRRDAEKDLARNKESAAKHVAKLVKLQGAEATQGAADQLDAGSAQDAVRTAERTAVEGSSRSPSAKRTGTSAKRSGAKTGTSAKRSGARTGTSAKRSGARTGTTATGTGAKKATARKAPAKRSSTRKRA